MTRRNTLFYVVLAVMLAEIGFAIDYVDGSALYFQHAHAALIGLPTSAVFSVLLALIPVRKDPHDFRAAVLTMGLRLFVLGMLGSFLVAAFVPHDWRLLCWSVWLATVVFYISAALVLKLAWQRAKRARSQQLGRPQYQ